MTPVPIDAAPRTRLRFPPAPVWLTVLAMVAYCASLARFGCSGVGVATVAGVGVAALVAGVAGFAFSAICGAILFHFRHDSLGAVEIMIICSIANQTLSVWLLRRDFRLPLLAPFVIGGIAGVPFGVWLLLHMKLDTFTTTLGALLVAYGVSMLIRRPIMLPQTSSWSDLVAGFVGGMVGGFAATPGSAVSIWCGMKGWNKATRRALLHPFTLIMQFVVLSSIAAMHATGAPIIAIPPIAWACVPAGLVGTWWGMVLFQRLTDDQFAKAVNVLLIVSGIGLVA